MPSQTFEAIRAAIEARCEVVGTYDQKRREFLPFILGYDKESAEQALVYRTGPRKWRLYKLAKLRASEVRQAKWFTPADYNPDDDRFAQIVARVPR